MRAKLADRDVQINKMQEQHGKYIEALKKHYEDQFKNFIKQQQEASNTWLAYIHKDVPIAHAREKQRHDRDNILAVPNKGQVEDGSSNQSQQSADENDSRSKRKVKISVERVPEENLDDMF